MQKYHSIAARGEKVEEVLETFEQSDGTMLGAEGFPANLSGESNDLDRKPDDTETSLGLPNSIGDAAATNVYSGTAPDSNGQLADAGAPQAAIPPSTAAAPAAFAAMQDDSMKNLMMSWYYAGYYTGLHEGQQKAHAMRDAP